MLLISGKESQSTFMAQGGDCERGAYITAWEELQRWELTLSWALHNSCKADKTTVRVVSSILALIF